MRSRRSVRSGMGTRFVGAASAASFSATTQDHQELAAEAAPTGSLAASLDRHAGQCTAVGIQQMQCITIEPGRQDHPFADAKAHLARREVGDEYHAAADELVRLGIGSTDAGEDLALAQFAGIEFEAQQLVGALDEAARQHLAYAQVESGEV